MRDVTLDDKYTTESGCVFLTGVQALTLLPMVRSPCCRRKFAASATYGKGRRWRHGNSGQQFGQH